MKQIFTTILCAFVLLTSLSAEEHQGYIITKDGKYLTGHIGEIFYSDILSTVVFINDFGTPYRLQPELIGGFVFKQPETETAVEYQSTFKDGQWCFLRIIEAGSVLTLYQSHDRKADVADSGRFTRAYKVQEYWLQIRDDTPEMIPRIGFRSTMRRKLWAFPAIAKKVGKQGYRYKNIQKIVQEVNETRLFKRI